MSIWTKYTHFMFNTIINFLPKQIFSGFYAEKDYYISSFMNLHVVLIFTRWNLSDHFSLCHSFN